MYPHLGGNRYYVVEKGYIHSFLVEDLGLEATKCDI